METDNKKEFFVFDHVADQHASQMDIYRTIGEDVVQRGFDVKLRLFRVTIAASSLMDKPAQVKPIPCLAISSILKETITPNSEGCFLVSSKMCSVVLPAILKTNA